MSTIAKISALYKAAAQRYKAFASKTEMDENLSVHILAAGRKLHKNARAILDLHVKYSCIVPGVSWLGRATVAATLGVHERTIERAYERLESLGIANRVTVELGGMILSFLVIRPFVLSVDCPEFVSDLSQSKSSTEQVVPTVEAAFSPGETIETTESSNKKQDDEDDIYNAHVREESPSYSENTMHFNVFQTEIYEIAQEYGFNAYTARLFALRSEGIRMSIQAIHGTFTAVIERISSQYLPRVVSLSAYFAATLRNELEREQVTYVQREKERQERAEWEARCSGFVPYNWLEEEPEADSLSY